MSSCSAPGTRADYGHCLAITTRWSDNDVYGHINNGTNYSFFDTAVNTRLIGQGALDIQASPAIGLVVETGCRYARPLAYPMAVTAGMRVVRLGASSVRYEVGVFGGEAAEGHFIHVHASRASGRPLPLPLSLPPALESILVPRAD